MGGRRPLRPPRRSRPLRHPATTVRRPLHRHGLIAPAGPGTRAHRGPPRAGHWRRFDPGARWLAVPPRPHGASRGGFGSIGDEGEASFPVTVGPEDVEKPLTNNISRSGTARGFGLLRCLLGQDRIAELI